MHEIYIDKCHSYLDTYYYKQGCKCSINEQSNQPIKFVIANYEDQHVLLSTLYNTFFCNHV